MFVCYVLLRRKRSETEYGFSPRTSSFYLMGRGQKPNCKRVTLWNKLITEMQFIAENIFFLREGDSTSISIFILLNIILISPQNGSPSRIERSRASWRRSEAVALTLAGNRLWNLPPPRTMLLISRTIFLREQKLSTPHRKSFSRRYLVGEAPGTQQRENRQAVLGFAKRHKLWIPAGATEVSRHIFSPRDKHVLHKPWGDQLQRPPFLLPLPWLLLERVRDLGGGWQNQLEPSPESSIWGAVGKELGVYFRWQT